MQVLENARESTSEKIFSLLFSEDELTWQNIIYDMIDSQEIDPWDVDIGLLAQKFIHRVRMFKEMDFRISGKVILAAAILLKIKSHKLVEEDIAALDSIINAQDEAGDFLEELQEVEADLGKEGKIRIFPRTPQPRKRKVSVYDLVRALEQALEVESRRKRWIVATPALQAPKKPRDITLVISDVYNKILLHYKDKQNLTFTELLPSASKEDKVLTFIPLLHLETQRKVDMDQREHFGEIFIHLCKNS